jgi:tetratricopeptide (TPR) repeat protein
VSAFAEDGPIDLPSKGDHWIEVHTRNFTLYGDASESKTKDVGLDMERLRAVLVALKRGNASMPAPTRIYVFRNHQALEPYLPRVDGKPGNFSGFYQGGWDANYATLSAQWNLDPRPTVYFSFIYDFIRANYSKLPLWYETGVAGYYSTFRSEGDEARTGMISEDDLRQLRGAGMWISLDRLFAIDHGSPEYVDRERRSVYFAETWALLHYLMRGNEARTPQLSQFVALLGQGRPQDEAFREAFHTDYATLYGELVAYVRNNTRYFYNRARFSELKPPTETRVSPMTYEQVLVRLGDLLASDRDRAADAERFYQAALAADPASSGALAGLGWLRREQKRDDEAAALLTKAAEGGSTDYRVYYAIGRLRWEEFTKQPLNRPAPSAGQRELLDAARSAFRKSIELEPDFAEARVALGRTYRAEPPGANVDEGIAALEEAHRRLPSREDVSQDLALLEDRKGEKANGGAMRASVPGDKGSGAAASVSSGGKDRIEEGFGEINALLDAGKDDEALARMDAMIAASSGEVRTELEAQRDSLKTAISRNRAVREYNAAIALYNKRDLTGALAAFQKLADTSPDADIAKAAREKAAIVRAQIKGH